MVVVRFHYICCWSLLVRACNSGVWACNSWSGWEAGMAAERSRNWKKRKTPEEGDGKDPYAAILESTSKSFQAALTESVQAQIKAHSRSVQAQIEAQKQEYELDRAQRKEQGDRLIGVLTALVDTLGKIADKL